MRKIVLGLFLTLFPPLWAQVVNPPTETYHIGYSDSGRSRNTVFAEWNCGRRKRPPLNRILGE